MAGYWLAALVIKEVGCRFAQCRIRLLPSDLFTLDVLRLSYRLMSSTSYLRDLIGRHSPELKDAPVRVQKSEPRGYSGRF